MPSPTQDIGRGSSPGPGPGSSQSFGQGSAQQGSAQQSGSSTGLSDVKADAQRLGTTASNRLHSELDARKGNAAAQVRSLSSAISQAGQGLDEGAPQWLRSAFEQGAQKAQTFADSLEQKDSRQIMNDIETIARNNPSTFIAACAAIGFAASRIFKAGASDSSSTQDRPALPPAQGEEPMFRSAGEISSKSATTPGEFV